MIITSYQQLTAQIDHAKAGELEELFRVDEEGHVRTHGGISLALQKLHDAAGFFFRKNNESTSLRNDRLYEAMAKLPSAPELRTPRALAIAGIGIRHGVLKLPQEMRPAAARLLRLMVKHAAPFDNDTAPHLIIGDINRYLERMAGDPVTRIALSRNTTLVHSQLQTLHAPMTEEIGRLYEVQKEALIREGFHKAFFTESVHNGVKSINGFPLDRSTYAGKIWELIPDETMRGFVTMLISRNGLDRAVNAVFRRHAARLAPEIAFPCAGEMIRRGLALDITKCLYDLEIRNGVAMVTLDTDVMVVAKPVNLLEGRIDGETALGGGHYRIGIKVDLHQNLKGKTIPSFQIIDCKRTPAEPDDEKISLGKK